MMEPLTQQGLADPYAGRIIAGRFLLEKCIGRGGMGVVYLASHRVLERFYAIKFLRREFIHDREALLRFFREAKAASVVDHPNIVSIYDYGHTDEGEPYLVMEYVNGVLLFQALSECADRCLPVSQALDIAIQICRALCHAHERGVVHRDIKPENVLLTLCDGQLDWVKVMDFGIARMITKTAEPATGPGQGIIGTPEFMAPELLRGSSEAGPKVDLYALGILLHDLIAGSPPFSGDMAEVLRRQLGAVPPPLSQRQMKKWIPADLDALIERLLAKDPARRPTAAEALILLEQVRTQLPPRSLRSLLIAQTLILPPRDQRRLLLQQRTVLLSRNQPLSVMSAGDTARLPTLLREIDTLEADLDRVAVALRQQVELLGDRLFGTAWPREAADLRTLLQKREEAAEHLGISLALLQDRNTERHRQVQLCKEELRQKIIGLSERLQLDPLLKEDERQAIIDALMTHEREFVAAEGLEDPSLQHSLSQVARKMEEMQADQRRFLGQLGRLLLGQTLPQALLPERTRTGDLLGRFDDLLASLSRMPRPDPAGEAITLSPARLLGDPCSR